MELKIAEWIDMLKNEKTSNLAILQMCEVEDYDISYLLNSTIPLSIGISEHEFEHGNLAFLLSKLCAQAISFKQIQPLFPLLYGHLLSKDEIRRSAAICTLSNDCFTLNMSGRMSVSTGMKHIIEMCRSEVDQSRINAMTCIQKFTFGKGKSKNECKFIISEGIQPILHARLNDTRELVQDLACQIVRNLFLSGSIKIALRFIPQVSQLIVGKSCIDAAMQVCQGKNRELLMSLLPK